MNKQNTLTGLLAAALFIISAPTLAYDEAEEIETLSVITLDAEAAPKAKHIISFDCDTLFLSKPQRYRSGSCNSEADEEETFKEISADQPEKAKLNRDELPVMRRGY